MYEVSTDYKSYIHDNLERDYRVKLTVGTDVIDPDDIFSCSIETNQPSDKFTIGNAISQMLKIEIKNQDKPFYVNQLYLEIGMLINGDYEYVPIGYFNVDKSEKKDNRTTLTCYDNMYKLEGLYVCDLGSTKTIKDILTDIGTKTGIVMADDNYDNYTISDEIVGYSYREVVAMMAGLNGANAYIGRDGKIKFVYLNNNTTKWSINDFYLFDGNSFKEQSYIIDKVTCYKDKDTSWSNGNLGTTPMTIEYENPFMTESIAKDIYNKLVNITYQAFNMDTMSYLALDVGDWITYTSQNNTVYSLCIQHYKFSGGIKQTLESKVENRTDNFNVGGSLTQKVNRTITDLLAAKKAIIKKANIDDLVAGKITFETASGGSATIQDILTQFISGDDGQFLHLTTGNVVIDEAVIKSAMIDSISADKITTGTIDANKVTLLAEKDGYKLIQTGRLYQWFKKIDDEYVLIAQMGFDASNKFSFAIKDDTGTFTKYDQDGITKNAVPDGLIVDDMVADDANIQGKKLDIDSVITEINNGTKTIKGSKVLLDTTGQTAELSFKQINETIKNFDNRNLLLNTKLFDGNVWEVNGTAALIEEEYNGLKVYSLTTDWSSYRQKYNFVENQVYTFSFYAKSTVTGVQLKFYNTNEDIDDHNVGGNNSIITENVSTEWTRYNITFKDLHTAEGLLRVEPTNITALSGILYICGLKLEKGNIATDYTEAPEDISERTVTLQTEFNIQQGKIEDLIKDTEITKEGTTVKLKDAYEQTVKDVNGITQNVSKIETKVDNLSVGARNLLLNTLNFDGTVWIINDATKSATKWGNFTVVDVSKNWGSYRQNANYTVGKEYTFSFYAKAEKENVQINLYNTNSSVSDTNAGGNATTITTNCSTTWTRYNVTFIAKATSGLIRPESPNITSIGGKFSTCGYMLEEGNILSSYNQAPEDIESDINGIEQRVSSCEVRTTDEAFTVQVQKNQNRVYNVRYIRDYVSGSNKDTTNHWADIQIFNNYGSNVALNKTPTSNKTLVDSSYVTDGITDYSKCAYTASAGLQYVQIDLGTTYNNIDEIKVWHYYADNRIYNSTKTEISADGTTWVTLFDSAVSGTYAESSFGHSVKVNNSSFNSSDVTINELGLHVRNGSIDIQNTSGDTVFSTDVNGNLKFIGEMEQRDPTTGYLSTAIRNNGVEIYDWRNYEGTNADDLVGGIIATKQIRSDGQYERGATFLYSDIGNLLHIGHKSDENTYTSIFTLDNTKQEFSNLVKAAFLEDLGFKGNTHFMDYADLKFYGSDYSVLLGNIGLDGSNHIFLAGKKDFGGPKLGYLEYNNTTLSYVIDVAEDSATVYGNFTATGSKNRVVKTKDYGWLAQNAYETAECYFGDFMYVTTDSKGYCRVNFDPKFLETVNTKCDYHVIHSCYGDDDDVFPISKCIEKTETYFVIKTNIPFTKVSVSVSCKQIDYENTRLVQKNIKDKSTSNDYSKLDKKMEADKNENK